MGYLIPTSRGVLRHPKRTPDLAYYVRLVAAGTRGMARDKIEAAAGMIAQGAEFGIRIAAWHAAAHVMGTRCNCNDCDRRGLR